MIRVAVLDDYLSLSTRLADWSVLEGRCSVDVLTRNLLVPDEAAKVLADYEVICHTRERMAMPRGLIERLPKLKLLTITPNYHRTLDLQAAADHGIMVCHSRVPTTGFHAAPELAWGLLLSLARNIPLEDRLLRSGGSWQTTCGTTLHGKTLGLLGLGKIGRRMAEFGKAFGMRIIAWSENLTCEAAYSGGAELVGKYDLFRLSDFLSIHLVLSDRSRGLVGAAELALMKPTAFLVNTARGPIVQEGELLKALRSRQIAGAGLDVFDVEPLPLDHPLRSMKNVIITPHLGYCAIEVFEVFYRDTVEEISAYIDGAPIRIINGATA